VRISDAALVAAATLSHRYITDRFLPDKAIDLMDEASSRLRMEVDSKPEELDALDRQILQMQIEAEALKKEDDAASKDRLEKLEKELSDLQQQSAEMTAKWQAERDKLDAARTLQGEARPCAGGAGSGQARRGSRQGRGAQLRRDPAA
jgi:ATP-dependent Clp protease ATP-binding subunit ClpB